MKKSNVKDDATYSFKKKVIKFSVIVIILMGIFPPWSYVFKGGTAYTVKPASYGFLLSPPPPEEDFASHGVKLDFSRLLLQWFLVVVTATSLIYLKSEMPDD